MSKPAKLQATNKEKDSEIMCGIVLNQTVKEILKCKTLIEYYTLVHFLNSKDFDQYVFGWGFESGIYAPRFFKMLPNPCTLRCPGRYQLEKFLTDWLSKKEARDIVKKIIPKRPKNMEEKKEEPPIEFKKVEAIYKLATEREKCTTKF